MTSMHLSLPEDEKNEAKKFAHEGSRLEYIATRSMIRSILSRHLPGTPPASWEFTRSPEGKPELKNSPVRFSLSHARGVIAAAVTIGAAVGIDIEPVDPLKDVMRLAPDYFSTSEILDMKASQDPLEFFYERWVLKESLLKGMGTGFNFSARTLEFTAGTPKRVSGISDANWSFGTFTPAPGMTGAWACHGQAEATVPRFFKP